MIDHATFLELVQCNADGLVPCAVQEADGGEVLMVAHAEAVALQATLATGEAHFWSRSRRELWHKGAPGAGTAPAAAPG